MYYYYYYYVIKTKTVWRVWLNNQTGCCYKITADSHNTWNERTSQVHCGIQYCTVWADYIVSILENAVDRSAFLCIQKICILLYVHNIYWMNEWCIYIALYCVLLYTQSALQSCGGVSPQPPPVCSIHLDDATAATGQRRQSAHHTPATGGEEREILIKWIFLHNQVNGDY